MLLTGGVTWCDIDDVMSLKWGKLYHASISGASILVTLLFMNNTVEVSEFTATFSTTL
jgi:hypothetical protein